MSNSSSDAFASISFWAVSRLPGTSQVVIKFNDMPPVLMTVAEAKELSAAVNAELDDKVNRASLVPTVA